MDDMEEKLGAILNNPQMMQQIMSMAQSFGGSAQNNSAPPKKQESPTREAFAPDIDLGMVQKISGLARQSRIDKREQALLRALGAYLSNERLQKLERAMKAAKIAKIASSALGQGGLSSLLGR